MWSTATVVTSILTIAFGMGYKANWAAIAYLGMAEGFTVMALNAAWAFNWYSAYQVVKDDAEDGAIDTAEGIAAVTYMADLEQDMMWLAIGEASMMIFSLRYTRAWSYGMKEMMDGDKKDGDKKDDKDGPKNLFVF